MEKQNKKIIEDLPEDINNYLLNINFNLEDIDISNHEDLICKIICHVPISRDKAEIILKTIFICMRNVLLSGNRLNLYNLGKIAFNKKGIFIKSKNSFRIENKEHARSEKNSE